MSVVSISMPEALHEVKEKAHDCSRGMNPTKEDTPHEGQQAESPTPNNRITYPYSVSGRDEAFQRV